MEGRGRRCLRQLLVAVGSLLIVSAVATPGSAAPSAGDRPGRNVDITNADGAQSETTVAVDPTNPNHMLAASNDLAGEGSAKVYESLDRGRTWSLTFDTSPKDCYDTWLDFSASGDAFFAYECLDQRLAFRKAGQSNWTASVIVGGAFGPDRDMVAVDTTPTSPFAGSVYVAYTESFTSASLVYSRTGFGGWTKSPKINETASPIGVNAAVAPDGTVYATWLDYSRQKLFVDRSTDGGATWGTDHLVTNYRLHTEQFIICIPPQPHRCIIPFPFGVVAPAGSPNAGRFYVTYTDRSVTGVDTDVFVRFSDDDGLTWSSEVRVNDDGVGAYQFHPRIAVLPDGTLGLAFYDTRNDPSALKTDTYISFSADGGLTWSANQRVTTGQSDESGSGDANDYGDYQGIDAGGTSFFQMVWTDSRPGTKAEDMATASARP